MSDRKRELSKLMGAHMLALSKATAVYQAELAKVFLGLEDKENRSDAGPAYEIVRDVEKVGLASSMFDQTPGASERRMRSWTGTNAVLMQHWMELLGQPWRAYTRSLSRNPDDESQA